MFNSKKNEPSQTSSSFGQEFIHTMKDDLNPSLKSVKPATETLGDSPFGVQPTKKSEIPASTPSNPFIEKNTVPKKDGVLESQPSAAPSRENKNASENYNFSTKEKIYADNGSPHKKSSLSFGILIMTISLLVLLVLGGGAYYLWTTKTSPSTNISETDDFDTISEETPDENPADSELISISPISEKYSSEKPNYLSLDVETMTAEEIKVFFSETAKEVSTLQTKTPYEFIITDSNNNPLAFTIFTTLANINISPSILSGLNEKFSFFIHDDEGKNRTGIAIDIKNESTVLSELKNEETKTLIDSLSFLFLYEPYLSKKADFIPAVYNNVNSRYLNLDEGNTLSVDYGIYENRLIIGTSQNSFRAILDKILSEKKSPLNEPPIQAQE